MLYEVRIKEVYEYTTFIEAEDDTELDNIIHEEVPTLLDMTEDEVETVKEDTRADFQFYNEYESYERG